MPAKQVSSPGMRLTWSKVVQALQDPEARSGVLAFLKARKLGPDSEWTPAHQKTLVNALTWAEDMMEERSHGRMTGDRMKLRAFRRRLEASLWP